MKAMEKQNQEKQKYDKLKYEQNLKEQMLKEEANKQRYEQLITEGKREDCKCECIIF